MLQRIFWKLFYAAFNTAIGIVYLVEVNFSKFWCLSHLKCVSFVAAWTTLNVNPWFKQVLEGGVTGSRSPQLCRSGIRNLSPSFKKQVLFLFERYGKCTICDLSMGLCDSASILSGSEHAAASMLTTTDLCSHWHLCWLLNPSLHII